MILKPSYADSRIFHVASEVAATWLFGQQFVQDDSKESIKAPQAWSIVVDSPHKWPGM